MMKKYGFPRGDSMDDSSHDRALRARAEARLRDHPESEQHFSLEEAQRLIHELRVHQIELELQNEELRRTQQEARCRA